MQALDEIRRRLPPLTATQVDQALRGVEELPALPAVVERILALPVGSDTKLADLARTVAHDPAITARVLKVANSSFYAPLCEIKTLDQAIMRVGFEEVRHLCAAAKLIAAFPDYGDGLTLTVEDFWRHSVACGMVARFLAGKLGVARPEELFFAGLLHDFGKMVICQCFPSHFAVISALAAQNRCPCYALEREILGFDHAFFGESVAARWRLPQMISAVIAGHHNVPPASENAAWGRERAVVHLADYLSHLLFAPPVMCLLSDNIWRHLPDDFRAGMKDFWDGRETLQEGVNAFFREA